MKVGHPLGEILATPLLLRHHIIGVRLPNQRAVRETAKISSAQSKNAREYWQQPTLSSEGGQLAKTANGIAPD